ncbi:MAG: general secretion pathway protein GspB [Thermodesulfobacteriota bacterium]
MSYILEALKKSDQQRPQEKVPDLNTVQVELSPVKKKKASWLFFLAAILLLNVILVLFAIMRQDQPATGPQAVVHNSDRYESATVQEKQNNIVPQSAQVLSPVIPEPSPADPVVTVDDKSRVVSLEESGAASSQEPSVAAPVVHARDTEKAEDKMAGGINIAGGQEEAHVEPVLNPEEEATYKEAAKETVPAAPSTIVPQENFDLATELESSETTTLPEEQAENPEINRAQQALLAEPAPSTSIAPKNSLSRKALPIYQLPTSIRQQLPEIHIAAHAFYKNKPSSRFASINGKMMREGYTLAPDLKVAEISPDGVIFSYQKYIFHVPVF